jgi:hypothetical protein
MNKILNRQDVERQISEMWEEVAKFTDDDNGRQDAVDKALAVQQSLSQQLNAQERAFAALWPALIKIDPLNPVGVALQISVNAERLVPVLQAYKTGGNG